MTKFSCIASTNRPLEHHCRHCRVWFDGAQGKEVLCTAMHSAEEEERGSRVIVMEHSYFALGIAMELDFSPEYSNTARPQEPCYPKII